MTYGILQRVPVGWIIAAQPHVMIRIKRIFPRARWSSAGIVTLSDTLDVARDIEWLAERWPLKMTADVAAYLNERATMHRSQEVEVRDILAGHQSTLGFKEPARPAREYQQQAADIIHATGRLLVADDVGLGKTMTSLLVLRDPDALPCLVVTLTHLPQQWLDQLELTLPWLTGHAVTKGKPYDLEERCGSVPDVLVMNYSKLYGWSDHLAGQVRTVIFDEIQELRHSGTDKYHGALSVTENALYRVGLSATPVYNYGGEIHNILQVLDRDALGARDEFVREWGGGMSGMGNHVTVSNPAALGTWLRDQGLMLRRTRKDVHRELPDPIKIEQPIDTDTALLDKVTGDVADIAKLILSADTDKTERWQAAGDLDWRMRHATGLAKAPFVAEFARLLLESEDRIVIFGWHHDVYDIWRTRLAEFNPVFYTGEQTDKQKRDNAHAFLTGLSRVLIMSLRAGAGLDGLQDAASVVVFGELDWSPGIHTQCIGRLHRDGQEATVVAYFLVSEGGTDPLMAEVLNIKRQQADPITDPDAPLIAPAPTNLDRIRRLAEAVIDGRASRPDPDQIGLEL